MMKNTNPVLQLCLALLASATLAIGGTLTPANSINYKPIFEL
jgi:hypothetical protein